MPNNFLSLLYILVISLLLVSKGRHNPLGLKELTKMWLTYVEVSIAENQ